MYSPRLVKGWRDRLHEKISGDVEFETRNAELSKKRDQICLCQANVKKRVHDVGVLRKSLKQNRLDGLSNAQSHHFTAKVQLYTASQLQLPPSDRQLFARYYTKVDHAFWTATDFRTWYNRDPKKPFKTTTVLENIITGTKRYLVPPLETRLINNNNQDSHQYPVQSLTARADLCPVKFQTSSIE